MAAILFIHGFATGPSIWQVQIDEFSKDFNVVTDVGQIERGSDVFVVGWSMGGWKALDLCKEHHQKIKGLILVSAFAKYVKSDDYPCGTPLALLRKLEKKFMADYKTGMHYFYDLMFKDKKQYALIEKLPIPEKSEVQKWFDKLKNDDKREMLSEIDVPVLLIHGGEDPIVSPDAATCMKERIKNCELHVFPGVGHVPFIEEKEKFNSILREFFKKHENG